MNNQEYLKWLHDRLVNEYGVNVGVDWMHNLRAIIRDTPEDQDSRSIGSLRDGLDTDVDPNFTYSNASDVTR